MAANQSQTVPAVFMFQPTEFEDVPVERLDEWEKDLREFVGLDGAKLLAGATGTTSKCPKKDDCDSRPKEQ
jgi:hypothetical protein